MKYTLTHTLSTPGRTLSASTVQEAGAEAKIDQEPLAPTASNAVFDIALPFARIKSIILMCTQPCTIKTNSSSSPAQTITLAANIPITWDSSSNYACPITADVTKLYITNDSSPDAAGLFSLFALYDPTA